MGANESSYQQRIEALIKDLEQYMGTTESVVLQQKQKTPVVVKEQPIIVQTNKYDYKQISRLRSREASELSLLIELGPLCNKPKLKNNNSQTVLIKNEQEKLLYMNHQFGSQCVDDHSIGLEEWSSSTTDFKQAANLLIL